VKHIAQLDSFKEENEKLKRQIFMTDKIRTQLESKVIDTEDNIERIRKESERYRKKYNESKGELDKALREMENYGRILDQFEAKVKKLEMDNLQIVREKEDAIVEVKKIRIRYSNIVGVDQFKKDFPL
jgi:chromosome segregation ATPase